jgi:hypothetical protein
MEKIFIAQLDEVINEYENACKRSRYDDVSVFNLTYVQELETRCLSAIQRASGDSSIYMEQVRSIMAQKRDSWEYLAQVIGVAKSLKYNLYKGYLKSFEELIHGDVFTDYLEMAEHLCTTGYKDAAAVIAGSTLEAHLKKLCAKFSVSTTSDSKAKKADTLNSELVKAGAYTKLDQKNVTSWLDLRNNAAHGNYNNYNKDQVALLISSVRDFIVRHAA